MNIFRCLLLVIFFLKEGSFADENFLQSVFFKKNMFVPEKKMEDQLAIGKIKNINLYPQILNNKIFLYAKMMRVETEKSPNSGIFSESQIDSIVKKINRNDVIFFCDFIGIGEISQEKFMNLVAHKEGLCPVYILYDFSLEEKRKYWIYLASIKKQKSEYVIESLIPLVFDVSDSLWITGCRNNKCSVFSSNVCWRKNAQKDCYNGNVNGWMHTDFEVKPQCDWLVYNPLPKAHKRNGVKVPALGFLAATKEGVCKIKYKKGGVERTTEIVSVLRHNTFFLYMKNGFPNREFPDYPREDFTYDLIEKYRQHNEKYR